MKARRCRNSVDVLEIISDSKRVERLKYMGNGCFFNVILAEIDCLCGCRKRREARVDGHGDGC